MRCWNLVTSVNVSEAFNFSKDEHTEREKRSEKTPFSFDDPPDGVLPGEDPNCRCYAEPVLDDLLGDDPGD